MGGQQFLFQAADGQDFAAEGDFSGHGEIAAYGNLAESAGNGGGNGDTGGGPVFRDRAFGHVYVQIERAVEIAREAETMRARAHIRQRRLRGLLHYVAEFAGQGELAFAVDYRGLDAQAGAADFGPAQSA